jgi:hypothetical protein
MSNGLQAATTLQRIYRRLDGRLDGQRPPRSAGLTRALHPTAASGRATRPSAASLAAARERWRWAADRT